MDVITILLNMSIHHDFVSKVFKINQLIFTDRCIFSLFLGVCVFRWDRSPRPDSTRSPWALKKLNKRDLPRVFEQRLEKEAALLKSLNHPNIVGFRACVPGKDGRMTLAMESCESSLADRIEDRRIDELGPFGSKTILKVALGVARGLDYLHREKKLLHGDMKSYNILIKGKNLSFRTINKTVFHSISTFLFYFQENLKRLRFATLG